MDTLRSTNSEHLYLQIAGGLEKMIEEDVLKIGDKLPSVRMLSEEYGISMGTAFQAYYHLEAKGLIESRPKSGYYVRFNLHRYPAMPVSKEPDQMSHEVSVKDMINSIYTDIVASDVINFALAVPDPSLLPAAKLNKSVNYALRNTKDHCLDYENTQGNTELRQQISRLAFNWGGKIKPDEIIITSGCLDAITICLKAVTLPGDTVAVESPAYFGIYQAIECLNLKVVEIKTDPVTGVDIPALKIAIRKSKIKACVFVPNYNNPLGSCMPDEMKKELVDLITSHNIPLIEDDIYGELYFGRNRPKTCKYFDMAGLVLHCSSLSKSLSPGYRIGWAIPGKYFHQVSQIKRIQNISCATVTQAAMAHYLKVGRFEYHLKNLRRALHTQSLRYAQAIIEYFPEDTKISRPHGGFILWIELNRKVDTFRLRTEAMKHQISVVPGKIFSANCDYSNCLRLSFGRPWDEHVDYGIMMLGKIIKKMIG